ncbi:DNA sulfur modification protein DndB [Paenibacillus sp. N1-5-1-14]|uniref:DNA sulfur modification protein DndB n=1 Tax=Paenibacillus radicibacter TaxID=2972488 RepID=UPI002158A6EF|nr:DNA sulfur modification protein DndB [Paenibacillus radicibacter]MCR8641458.1 DNA sulfur modification protein DndB [Paenibacillus radicibacter]
MENQIVELSDVLPLIFAELNKNKEQQREIEEILATKHKILRGTFAEILVNYERIDQLNQEELIILVNVLFDVTQDTRIKPTNFYNNREITKANKYQQEKAPVLQFPYTFNSVIAAPSGRDYVTIMDVRELRDLWFSKILTYNFNTQRLSKKKLLKNSKISEKADVNMKSVKNIARLMLEGKFKADTILLNILVDGNDNIEYSDGELTIHEGTTINLIDGMHRLQGMIAALEENPDLEGFINVAIKHYPLEEAQFLLGQINTVNRFDKTLVKHYMAETIGAQITKDLMNIPELKNRISIKTTLDKKLNFYTNFAILSEAIDSIFEPQNNKDRYDITEVLKKFFGYLVPSFENELEKNKKEVAKISWINHHNLFVGFVVIAKKLYDKYGKDFPVDEIVRIINGIDLSRSEGSKFNDLMTTQGKVNSNKVKKQIREFFEVEVDSLLA